MDFFYGLSNGYNIAANEYKLNPLTLFDFDYLNAMEDYGDVVAKLIFDNDITNGHQKSEFKYGAHVHSHCSGLVKVTDVGRYIFQPRHMD